MTPTAPPTLLLLASNLGPCRATVCVEAIALESGRQRYRITEEWTPIRLDRIGAITEVTLVDDPLEATRLGREAIADWRAGSHRSDRLAPGGRLRQ